MLTPRSSQKSYTQSAADSLRGGSDTAQQQGKSIIDSASDAASSAAQTVKDTLGMGASNDAARRAQGGSRGL